MNVKQQKELCDAFATIAAGLGEKELRAAMTAARLLPKNYGALLARELIRAKHVVLLVPEGAAYLKANREFLLDTKASRVLNDGRYVPRRIKKE